MRVVFTFAAIFAACSFANAESAGNAADGKKDEVLAVACGREITRRNLDDAMEPLIKDIRRAAKSDAEFDRIYAQLSGEALRELSDNAFIAKDFKERGLSIQQAAADEFFEAEIKRNFGGDDAKFREFLASKSMTPEEYRKAVDEKLVVIQMRQMHAKSVPGVTQEEIDAYYEENRQKWNTPERVKFSRIELKGASPEALKAKAEKIAAELRAGTDFAEAAKKYGRDDLAKDGGSDGAWYSRGQLAPEIEKALFSMKPGEIGDPLVISNYALILKLEDKKAGGLRPLDGKLRDEISNLLASERRKKAYEAWMAALRKKYG